MSGLPPWLTIAQVAEHCMVDRTEVYYKMLPHLECVASVSEAVSHRGVD